MANRLEDYKVIADYLEKSNDIKTKRILELEEEIVFLKNTITNYESLGSVSDSIIDSINRKWNKIEEK